MPRNKQTRKKRPDLTLNVPDSEENTYASKMRTPQLRKYEALDTLGGNYKPTEICFREEEISLIESGIDNLIAPNKKGTKCRVLMITGSPGLGKTLCVGQILNKCSYKVICLNCNVIKSLREVKDILSEQLLPKKLKQQLSILQLTCQLQKYPPEPTILYMEQVELVLKCVPDMFSDDFFSLFSNRKFSILLIGISNTIDTLEKYSERLKVRIPDITNIVFKPYNEVQIIAIMESKLKQVQKKTDIKISFGDTMKFVAKKLENSGKGDLRVVFEFLKEVGIRVIPDHEQKEQYKVTIMIINEVLNKMKSSRQNLMLQIPFQQQIILIALYNRLVDTGEISTSLKNLRQEVKTVYDSLNIQKKRDIMQELSELQTYGFISLNTKNKMETRILLKITQGEIQFNFRTHVLLNKFIIKDQVPI